MCVFIKSSIILALFVFATGEPLYAKNPVYYYEPDEVELIGKIERQTFPGRPNYESIKNGDEIESGRYLRLDEPIDVVRSPRDENPLSETESEKDVKILHLTWDYEKSNKLIDKNLIGKKVMLKGHLFHRSTGHHHARVLMWVDEMKELTK